MVTNQKHLTIWPNKIKWTQLPSFLALLICILTNVHFEFLSFHCCWFCVCCPSLPIKCHQFSVCFDTKLPGNEWMSDLDWRFAPEGKLGVGRRWWWWWGQPSSQHHSAGADPDEVWGLPLPTPKPKITSNPSSMNYGSQSRSPMISNSWLLLGIDSAVLGVGG